MDLQNTFYLVAIIFIALLILLTLTISITILVIVKKAKDAYDKMERRFSEVKEAVTHPADLIFAHTIRPRKSKKRRK